jgi:hypothetical protein
MDYPEKKKKAMDKVRGKDGSIELGSFLGSKIPCPTNGDRWGKWRFDAKLLDLVYEEDGREQYAVDLKDMDSSARMMDWVFQVNMKAWATREDVGNLIEALDDLFRPQATLCSGGADKRMNATEYLRKRLKSGEAA